MGGLTIPRGCGLVQLFWGKNSMLEGHLDWVLELVVLSTQLSILGHCFLTSLDFMGRVLETSGNIFGGQIETSGKLLLNLGLLCLLSPFLRVLDGGVNLS